MWDCCLNNEGLAVCTSVIFALFITISHAEGLGRTSCEAVVTLLSVYAALCIVLTGPPFVLMLLQLMVRGPVIAIFDTRTRHLSTNQLITSPHDEPTLRLFPLPALKRLTPVIPNIPNVVPLYYEGNVAICGVRWLLAP